MIRARLSLGCLFFLWLPAAGSAPVWPGSPDEFGGQIVEALSSGDGPGFAALLDRDGLLDRALDGMDADPGFLAGARSGLAEALPQVGAMMANNLGSEARLAYLRTRAVKGGYRALVRVDLGDRGLNYIDFFLREESAGAWRIFDWLDYAQGQTYTDSLRMALALMVTEKPSIVGRLFGMQSVDTASAEQLAKMGRLSQEGNWAGWLKLYRTLPPKLRYSRVLLVNRVAAAGAVASDDEYLNAMSDLHQNLGDDPTLSLVLVDYYLLTENYDRAYAAVDRLDEYTGGDAPLTHLRAGIAFTAGDNEATLKYSLRAIEQDPDYEEPYWSLIVAGTRLAKYDAAMDGIRALESRFGYEFTTEQLAENEELSPLAASDVWKSERGAANPE